MAKLFEKHIAGFASLKPEFDALMARNATKAESEIKKLRAQAGKIARNRKPAIDRMIAQRATAFEALVHPATPVPSVERYLANVPIEVYSTAIDLDSWSSEPSNSWAKFKLDFTKSGWTYPSVVFRFIWENSTDKYALITVDEYLVLHGFCSLWSSGGLWYGERGTKLTMRPTLELIDYTTDPYPSLGKWDVIAVDMGTETGEAFDLYESESEVVFRGYDLRAELIAVPPWTAVGLHASVEMDVNADYDDGYVNADFISYDYGVIVPGVLITKVS
jgi:hypothetical protein